MSATALATHAVIGEKQSRALEPLLATPISTPELLAAKTLTPFLFALALTWLAGGLYVGGMLVAGEPGVWRTVLGPRTFTMFVLIGPLLDRLMHHGHLLKFEGKSWRLKEAAARVAKSASAN